MVASITLPRASSRQMGIAIVIRAATMGSHLILFDACSRLEGADLLHSTPSKCMASPAADSRLAGWTRCPDRPFQLPAHASGRPWPGWRRGRMLAGMSKVKRAVATRIAQRRAARAERQGVDLFNAKPFGPKPPVIRSATGELRQIVRWVRRHYWAVQAVLVATALTLTVLALVGQVAMTWCTRGHGLESVNVHQIVRFSSVCVPHSDTPASGAR
jgi:hypothetical protein